MAALGRNRYANGKILRLALVVLAAFVATPVDQYFFHQHVAPNLGRDIAVIGYQYIVVAHCEPDACANCLLPFAGGIGTHRPGALKIDRGAVKHPG